MAKRGSQKAKYVKLDFIVLKENRFGETNLEDLKQVVENDFEDEPAPQAIFKQDFNSELLSQYLNPGAIRHDLSLWMKYMSDPDEPQFITIPFPKHFREELKARFISDSGKDLIRVSRSFRDYFMLWAKFRDELEHKESIPKPSNNPVWPYGCSFVLGIFLLTFLFAGAEAQNFGATLPFILFFGAGIFMLLRSAQNKARNRRFSYELEVEIAAKRLARAKKKLLGFLERNPWFEPALKDTLMAIELAADAFIVEQEEHYTRVREANNYIDATDALVSSKISERRITPNKMAQFSPRDYEIYCAGWLEYLGGRNVRVTQQSSDGGIDIFSDCEVAQVKLHGSPVSVQPIRELFGVAQSMSKTPLFFTSTGFTQAAIAFAEVNDIFLFIADPVKEDLKGVNDISRTLMRTGLTKNIIPSDIALLDGNHQGNAHSGFNGYEDGDATDGYFNR